MNPRLYNRTSRRRLSRPNLERALERIRMELVHLVINSPIVVRDSSDDDVNRIKAIDAIDTVLNRVRRLWPRKGP